MDNAELNTISLCSGVAMLDEGVHAGLEHLGIRSRTVIYAEREAFPVSVLVARMEEGSLAPAPVWFGDFRELPAKRLRGVVDGVVAGFPCQDLSVAGRRAGLDGKRSGLFFNVLDIADVSGAWFLVLENVAGIASATASVVDEEEGDLEERAAARVMGELADRGWNAEWITLSASDVGASHGRARWFCFAWRVADARLQHCDIQQWRARSEHSGGGDAMDDSERAERRARRVSGTSGIEGYDSGRPEEDRGSGIAYSALVHTQGNGRIEGRAESSGQQGRLDVAKHGGAMADANGCGPSRISGREQKGIAECDATVANTSSAGRQRSELGRACNGNWGGGRKHMDQLANFVAYSPLVQVTDSGPESSPGSLGSPRPSQTKKLNPYFVEWLMGWPAGWTSPIAQPDYAPEATALYRSALRRQLSSLFADPASSKEAA